MTEVHAALAARPIVLFGCPSDSRTLQPHPLPDSTILKAFTSYLGVNGRNARRRDGLLFADSAVRFLDIADGTSSTLLVGERPPSADLVFGWWYAGWGQDQDGEGDMLLGARTTNIGSVWAKDCTRGPYAFKSGSLNDHCDSFHFWSLHSGGANFVFGDSSVRFLKYSADTILPALATRMGGEIISGEQLN